MYQYSYQTKIGEITIVENDGYITNVAYHKLNYEDKETTLIRKTYLELQEYLSGKRKIFDIPLKVNSTPFQMQVWHALQSIPYGQIMTYKDIANLIGNKKASRAVGMANNKNPIIIIIPCHRVIGANKNLTGYSGGLEIKKKLLEIEGIKI